MATRFRVALHGFSEFERSTLTFCLRHASVREPGYVHVELIADSDFIVADASHEAIAGSAVRGARMRDTLFIGEQAPLGASSRIARPIDPERILRALDRMAAQRKARAPSVAPDIVLPLAAGDTDFSPYDNFDRVDTTPAAFQHEPLDITYVELPLVTEVEVPPEPALPVALPAATRTPAAKAPRPPRQTDAERAAAKAEARRKSRQARQTQLAIDAPDAPRELLLLDSAPEPGALCILLESFGFRIHRATSVAAAMTVLAQTPIAAAFLDIGPRGAGEIDGLALCQQIKHQLLPLAGATPAVMLVAARSSAAERVRAKLAGCDAFLTRPVSRGDAARALESCNVALPADARRG